MNILRDKSKKLMSKFTLTLERERFLVVLMDLMISVQDLANLSAKWFLKLINLYAHKSPRSISLCWPRIQIKSSELGCWILNLNSGKAKSLLNFLNTLAQDVFKLFILMFFSFQLCEIQSILSFSYLVL